MKDADVQRMFRQLDLILNLIQETRREMNLLKQGGDHNADDPLFQTASLRKFSISGQEFAVLTGKRKFWKP